jgi:aminoglycoside phosphotransferase (APT) family kinase protein
VTSAALGIQKFRVTTGEAPLSRCSLSEFIGASGLRSLVIGPSKDPNAKVTVLLVSPESGKPVLAVKVPTTDSAGSAVNAEWQLLAYLNELEPKHVSRTIPRTVEVVDFEGRPALVMTAVAGVPMMTYYLRRRHTATHARVAEDFAAVGAWLADLQRATNGPSEPLNMDCGVNVTLASRFREDERLGEDLDQLAEIYARLRGDTVPRTVVHGDFWFGNVLVAGGRVSGVVDWEAGATTGEPVRDLVRFALMYALYLDPRALAGRRIVGQRKLADESWGAGVEYALNGTGWVPDLFGRFLGDGLARLGASRASWRDAALAGIAEVAALTDEEGFARRHLELFRRVSYPRTGRTGVR